MQQKRYWTLPLLLFIAGCGSDEAESPQETTSASVTPAETSQNSTSVDKLINPDPLLALSQTGNINNTPQFIHAQKVKHTFPDGRPQRELTIHFYRNGPNRFHGPFKEWYPSGGLWKEGVYEENNRVGEWKWHAENGTLVKQALYNREGKPDGTWIYYHDDGTKRRLENFKNGKRHGETEYYSQDGGQVLEKFSFKDNQLDGEIIRWFPLKADETEPQKRNHSYYLEDKRHGVTTDWYENGQMRSQIEFKNGVRHGHTRRWDTDGNLELELFFENGEPVDPGAAANGGNATPDQEVNAEDQSSNTPTEGETGSTSPKP